MAFTSIGYDGTVNERQWAQLVPSVGSSTYGVKGAGDLKVSAVPGQPLMVQVAAGTGWGHGVMDTEVANTTIACDAIASGTRWDLISLRRDWQPLAGGPTAVAKVTGTSEKIIPGSRQASPGVIDDQPLALVQWTAGQTQPTAIVDLRCWAGNGGMFATDDLVRTYLNSVGTQVTIGGVLWSYQVGANDTAGWVKASELGKIPLYAFGNALNGAPVSGTQFLVQAGTIVKTTNDQGAERLVFPSPFPNGLLSVQLTSGDAYANGGGATFAPAGGTAYGSAGVGDKASVVYEMFAASGAKKTLTPHRLTYVAIGW